MAAEPPINPSGELLDQAQIDQLLAQTAAQGRGRQVFLTGESGRGSTGDGETAQVKVYDFRQPVFLSEKELRGLRLIHEDFVRYLGARLSLFLRMEFGLKLARLTTSTYGTFTDELPNPTHLCLFKADPLAGVGIIDLNPRLALTIVDRMLGGRGHSVKAERTLTEIEVGLLEDILHIVLEEWCSPWKGEAELHPQILGHESNGRFLQTSSNDVVMLALTLEVNFGDCAEQMQIGVPYHMIEPLVKKIQARRQKDTVMAAAEKPRVAWSAGYDHIPIPVRAEWDGFETSLREIASLRVGDVLELPESLLSQTKILLNGQAKFIGTVGLDTDNVAVQITGLYPSR